LLVFDESVVEEDDVGKRTLGSRRAEFIGK
jgi:hypothetical protein